MGFYWWFQWLVVHAILTRDSVLTTLGHWPCMQTYAQITPCNTSILVHVVTGYGLVCYQKFGLYNIEFGKLQLQVQICCRQLPLISWAVALSIGLHVNLNDSRLFARVIVGIHVLFCCLSTPRSRRSSHALTSTIFPSSYSITWPCQSFILFWLH